MLRKTLANRSQACHHAAQHFDFSPSPHGGDPVMARRYLFGPVTPTFADEHLREVRQRGECLVFNAEGTVDVRLTPGETWSTLLGRLPGAWQPDCVALYLPYTTI